jgi:hypothetical protein
MTMSGEVLTKEGLCNAFTPVFLDGLEGLDEAATAHEAEMAGPWKVVATESGFALLRVYEKVADGGRPEGELADFPTALRFLAVLPSASRAPLMQLAGEPSEGWYAVRSEGHPVGRLRVFDDRLVQAAHVAECLARSPLSLAALLLSSGPLAIREVGRILDRLLRSAPTEAAWSDLSEFPPR